MQPYLHSTSFMFENKLSKGIVKLCLEGGRSTSQGFLDAVTIRGDACHDLYNSNGTTRRHGPVKHANRH